MALAFVCDICGRHFLNKELIANPSSIRLTNKEGKTIGFDCCDDCFKAILGGVRKIETEI